MAVGNYLEFEENENLFVTLTKSTISIHDSPNFLTKLSSDDLIALGIDSIPDALRLVPGMMVSDLHGSNTQVGYHGLAVSIPRRMDLLYNTSSMYRSGYAGIHWKRLPIDIEDIEFIEIIRGSASSDFGSNALTSAVNLVQNSIALEPSFFSSVKVGSSDLRKVRAGFHLESKNNHVYLRFLGEESSGYDFAERSDDYEDSFDGKSILLSGEHELEHNMLLDWNIAYNDYIFTAPDFNFIGESDSTESSQDSVENVPPADEKNIHSVIKISGAKETSTWNIFGKYSEFERDQEILFCNIQGSFDPLFAELDASPNVHIDPADFPLVIQSGLSTGVVQLDASIVNPLDANDTRILTELGQRLRTFGPNTILAKICGDADISTLENRVSIGGQFTQQLLDKLSLSSSSEYIYSIAESENYFKGKVTRNTFLLSNNLLYKPTKFLSASVGLMAEIDDYLDGFVFSPRAAINYHVNNNFSIKSMYSKSKRTPDLHETDRKWQISVDYLGDTVDFLGQSSANVFRIAESPGDLKPEEIESYELGVVYTSKDRRHIFDSKVFYEDMINLISDPFLYLDFNLTNDGKIRKKGFETAYSSKNNWMKYGLSYTYLDWDTSTPYESTLTARHIGSIWSIFNLSESSKLGFSFNGHSGGDNHTYKLYTLNYTKSTQLEGAHFDFQVGVKRYPKYTYTFTEYSPDDPVAIGFDNQNQYYMKISLSY